MTKLVLSGLRIVVAPKKRRTTPSGPKKVSKLVKGKVIVEDGVFKVAIDMKINDEFPDYLVIPFTEESYDLTGKQTVFDKVPDKKGRRVRYIRNETHAKFHPGSPERYVPFAPNWIVSGHVVKNNTLGGGYEFDFHELITIDGYASNVPHPELDEEVYGKKGDKT